MLKKFRAFNLHKPFKNTCKVTSSRRGKIKILSDGGLVGNFFCILFSGSHVFTIEILYLLYEEILVVLLEAQIECILRVIIGII